MGRPCGRSGQLLSAELGLVRHGALPPPARAVQNERAPMIRAILSALLATFVLHGAAAGKTARDAPPKPQGIVRLQLGEHLKIAQDIQLTGATDARTADFVLPSR